MCGLFGWMLSPVVFEKVELHTLAASLAFNAEKRGDDSWGVVRFGLDSDPIILKAVGSIRKTCTIRQILAPSVLGHTRKATSGAITQENAHPFHIGKIIGAHNGFVFRHEEINRQYKRDYRVDSQHIFAHLNENIPLSSLDASGTITYIKTDDPTKLYLGRGFSSDLVIYGLGKEPTDCLGIVWASVGSWVDEALEMAGIREFFPYKTLNSTLYAIENYRLMDLGHFTLSTSYYGVQHCTRQQSAFKSQDYTTTKETTVDTHDAAWNNWRRDLKEKGEVNLTRSDLDTLPKALKKNSEVDDVASWQTEEATSTIEQCDGCHRYGPRVDDYEDNVRGIMHWVSVDEWLCFTCSSYWGSYGTDTTVKHSPKKVTVDVPTLKLGMG